MTLKLLTGTEAIQCAGAADFQLKWKSLHALCPWATAYQHPDFVVPWYELYQSVFLPIIVFEENAAGFLVGLLTLALHRQGSIISGAGEQQAEYQSWLQLPAAHHFLVCAIRGIRALFPAKDIFLKYLPPGLPEWHAGLAAHWQGLVSVRHHRRPLMKADPAAMERQRRKKNHRQNFNRLAKSGNIQLTTVTEHDRFIKVFDAICGQYHFRQAALYRDMPFSMDPFKKPFYLELHKRGVLHATVLTVDTELAAAHIGLLSREHAVHLGITTYDPTRAVHSPGNLLLAMLGVQLATENIPWLDLTPGGDGYKEHFATHHDRVAELRIHGTRRRRWQSDVASGAKSLVKTRLLGAGYRPADIMARVRKFNSLSLTTVLDLPAALGRRYRSRCATLLYCAAPASVVQHQLPVSKDQWRDVLQFDACGASIACCDFLSAAMRKMERADHVYSRVQGGKLVYCCWARMGCASQVAGESPALSVPADAVVLFDLYVHPDIEQSMSLRHFFSAICADLAKTWPDAAVCYRGRIDAALREVLTGCDFIDRASARSTIERRCESLADQPGLTEEKEP